MRRLLLIIMAVMPFFVFGQEKKEEKKFGAKFSGFVKADNFYDTRQIVSAREGHFLLYPANVSKDSLGNDVNDNPSVKMLAIQSRLRTKITAPDAFGAKTSAFVEADFFGNTGDENGFRLRHAITKLDWDKTQLLFGQYWHPMFVTQCFPGTISFNTGVPIAPFSRNPQIRLTRKLGSLKVMLAALSQRDFKSSGAATSLSNSGVPDMQFQLTYSKEDKEKGSAFFCGAGAGYQLLRPQLKSDSGFINEELVEAISAQAFVKVKSPKVTFKLQGVYGQNMFDLLMLGGYAKQVDVDYDLTGNHPYTTVDVFSVWTDIHTNGKKFQTGIFAGSTRNLGAEKDFHTASLRGGNIAYVYRVSPRFVFISGKTKLATEVEYTTAGYGTATTSGYVGGVEDVSNVRVLFSVITSF